MKHLVFVSLVFLFITSCKKESSVQSSSPGNSNHIIYQLKDSLAKKDFDSLVFSGCVTTQFPDSIQMIRIPFKGIPIENQFVLVEINRAGRITKGRIIQVKRDSKYPVFTFEGQLVIQSLQRQILLTSPITKGRIVAFHQRRNIGAYTRPNTVMVQPDPYEWLPEVIVVGFTSAGGGDMNFATYLALQSLIAQNFYSPDGGSGEYYDYYSPLDGSPQGSSGGGGNGGDRGGPLPDPIEFEQDYSLAQESIDLQKYFKCFDGIPSAGASYSIELCTDIPSNNNPNAMLSLTSGVGHVFLSITKTNGASNVTQTFGFFMQDRLPTFSPFVPVPSRIIDNSRREVNASIEMTITESQFQIVKNKAMALTGNSYDITSYNCTDYALEIFNSVRTSPIEVASCHIDVPAVAMLPPVDVTINSSPQTLFKKLWEMQIAGGPEAPNIMIDQTHNTRSPLSKGPCE